MFRKLLNGGEDEKEPPESATATLIEDAPEHIQSTIEQLSQPEEEKHVVAVTDLTPEGNYGESWIVATSQRVAVIRPDNGHPPHIDEFPLSDIEEIKRFDYVGNGALRIETSRRACEIRFSLTLSDKFDDIKDVIEALRQSVAETSVDGQPGLLTSDILQARAEERARKRGRCPRCGFTLPGWTTVCPACLKKTQLLIRLFGYVKPYWFWSVASLALMFLVTGASLLPGHLQKILIDDVFVVDTKIGRIPFSHLRTLIWVSVAWLVASAISAFVGAARQYLVTWLGQRIILDMRRRVYEHLHRLSLSFFDRKSTGGLMYRMTGDIDRLQGFLANGLQQILSDLATIIIIAAYLFIQHATLAAITLLPVPIIVALSRRFGKRIYRTYHKIWRKASKMSAMMADAIPGVRVVKAFTQENREVEKFININEDLMNNNLRAAMMARTFYPLLSFLTTVGRMVIWVYGGYLVITQFHVGAEHVLTPGTLIAFIYYLGMFYAPVERLSQMNDQLQTAATSAERVFELTDTKPDIDDDPDSEDLPPIRGRVTFERVFFGYEPGVPVLQEVSFDVKPGEMIGLVGASGAGKTTLINLLCRFYDVKSGRVLIDGKDIRKVTVKSLRDQIAVVLQEPYLFHGTIAENISYGNPDASREEILAAAMAANAHDFIVRLPDGYDTMVGERGIRLSGGEKQRVSIARAVLKNPAILIFDEATSSVDTETEAQIREAIERLVDNRTTFAIAHRFSTLRNASRIFVMDRGRLVENGTHEELLALDGGIFAKLCRMQADMSKVSQDLFTVD